MKCCICRKFDTASRNLYPVCDDCLPRAMAASDRTRLWDVFDHDDDPHICRDDSPECGSEPLRDDLTASVFARIAARGETGVTICDTAGHDYRTDKVGVSSCKRCGVVDADWPDDNDLPF